MIRNSTSHHTPIVNRRQISPTKQHVTIRPVYLNGGPKDRDCGKTSDMYNRRGYSKVSPRRPRKNSPLWLNMFMGKKEIPENGIYSHHVDQLYKLLTRENSVMLPPLKTSGRVKANVSNYVNKAERQYVMRDLQTEGKLSKFARDEVYFPSINKDLFTCRECRRRYISDMYTEVIETRNAKKPPCVVHSVRAQFCDVLGKRYCSGCGEVENRRAGQAVMASYTRSDEDAETPDMSSHTSSRITPERKRVVFDPVPTFMKPHDHGAFGRN